jgi:electron transfer flavoprotein alpha subunit
MSVLVIAEHDHNSVKDATAITVTAAKELDGDVTVLVAGHDCSAAADGASKIEGVAKVLKIDDASLSHRIAENLAPVIADHIKDAGYSHVLIAGSTFGKNVLPRIAALLDTQQITDIIAIEGVDTFKRPIYGGQAIATVKSSDAIKLLTVRTTAFDKANMEGGSSPVEDLSGASDTGLTSFVKAELSESKRPDLTSARVVVSGGRGVGSEDDFKIIEALADKLGAAMGASRAAVDAGYISNDYQVGQTGKAVAPDLYIAIGLSGAIQHLAGMKDSKIIVAINKDEEAPIFNVADYGLVADLFDTVPELTSKL